MCDSFPFGFEGGLWDLILIVPYHCLSFYLSVFQCCGIFARGRGNVNCTLLSSFIFAFEIWLFIVKTQCRHYKVNFNAFLTIPQRPFNVMKMPLELNF